MLKRILAGVVLASPLAGCSIHIGGFLNPSHWVEDDTTIEFAVGSDSSFHCKTHNGAIKVVPRSDGQQLITANVHRRAGGISEEDAYDCLNAIEIIEEAASDTARLGWRWGSSKESSWSSQVAFDLEVPPDLITHLETHNGGITVSGMSGDCFAETHNGKIDLETTGERVSAEAHNGGITVRGAAREVDISGHNGPIQAQLQSRGRIDGSIVTHNGSIRLEGASGWSTMVQARTNNGGLTCDAAGARCTMSRNRMTAELGQAEGRLELVTHNGSIRIE